MKTYTTTVDEVAYYLKIPSKWSSRVNSKAEK